MSGTIVIKKPFDAHVHLRRGAMLRAVTPISAKKFWAGIVMPNTDPPIDSVEAAAEYKKEILGALPQGSHFEPLLTFYLTKNLKPVDIEKGWNNTEAKIFAVKSYPFGATTNSQWGYRSILEASDVLKKMEEVGMPLLLHGEVHLNEHSEEEDPYDGEKLFITDVLPQLLATYPKLRVSLEHLSTKIAADFMEKNGKAGQLVATVTPTHLMYDRKQAFSGGYKSLIHMKPLVKRTEDREAVRALVAKGLPFIHAGTDSAPHPENKKFSSSVAFGVFNSPVAVEMYTQVFDELNALDPLDRFDKLTAGKLGASKLENFLSVNGPGFFGLAPSSETTTLVKKDWQVTEPVVTDEGVNVWPIGHVKHGLGNETFHWQIKK